MNDSAVSSNLAKVGDPAPEGHGAETLRGEERWLFLFHQIPAEPAYPRVKTSRRLKSLGSLSLKSSVYVLPDSSSAREDFHWLRREIVDSGGEAVLVVGKFLAGTSDRQLVTRFQSKRDEEYAALAAAVAKAREAGRPSRAEVRRLRRRLEEIRERDHFHAPQRAAAEHALRGLDPRIHGGEKKVGTTMERPSGRTWVTRRGVFVDRMASGWLIRRFIDPEASFEYVVPDGYEPPEGALRFDMFEGEFTHEGDRCTFEVLMRRFGLDEPGLMPIAEIVHDIDCKDDKFSRPETAGIAALLGGIAAAHDDDPSRMAAAASVFEGLFQQFCQSAP